MTHATNGADYVAGVLQLNPTEQADVILRRRDSFLGIKRSDSDHPDSEQSQILRENLQNQLDGIRKHFWTAPLSQIQQTLAAFDASKYPDLNITIRRLQHLASLRNQFPQLAQHKRNNQTLFDAFTHVVILPPRDAGLAKERALQTLVAKQQVPRAKRMVRMLKNEFPHLYQLETDWFNQVLRLRKTARGILIAGQGKGLELPIPGWAIWIIILIIIKVLAAIARMGQ